ncbi:MAG: hypothetical protein ACFFC3_15215 [Candidatus Odinarchaeota archaeon]
MELRSEVYKRRKKYEKVEFFQVSRKNTYQNFRRPVLTYISELN